MRQNVRGGQAAALHARRCEAQGSPAVTIQVIQHLLQACVFIYQSPQLTMVTMPWQSACAAFADHTSGHLGGLAADSVPQGVL